MMTIEKYYDNISYISALDKAVRRICLFKSRDFDTLTVIDLARARIEEKYKVMKENEPYDDRINSLSDNDKRLFELLFLKAISISQIAKEHNVEAGQIRKHLRYLSSTLKMELKEKDNEEV